MGHWDSLDFSGVEADDPVISRLVEQLQGDTAEYRRAAERCWRLTLPKNWDDYLAMLSKGHRKQTRRMVRDAVDAGQAVLHTVEHAEQLPEALRMFEDLHQRRRQSLGQPGCFASRRFAGFLREAAVRMFDQRAFELNWLTLDGRVVAADYNLRGDGIVYAYQSGIEPEMLDAQPGRLLNVIQIRRSIEEGLRGYDFLRGDEPYKAHFRCQPREMAHIRLAAPGTAARLRHGAWVAGCKARDWAAAQRDAVGRCGDWARATIEAAIPHHRPSRQRGPS